MPMNGDTGYSAWLEASSGQRTPIRGSCFLGRSAACELVLADTKVSRQHALVQSQSENEYWLIDLGSANGTYLNGQRVRLPCRLANGDSISIAGFTFGFHCHRPAGRSRAETATDATVQEIRRQLCWLLVADIQGSTILLRDLPAEEAPRITGRWLAACRQILDERHGIVNKFLGDGVLAYWPSSLVPVSEIADALLSLRQLQDRSNPPFRMVLHYGQVSFSGVASLGEEGLSGSEVNFAFRMEKLAANLGIARLLSEAAQSRLAELVPATLEGQHVVPGFEGAFTFYSF